MKIFLSYAGLDDLEPASKVSKLRDAFEISLTQSAGEPCTVYSYKGSLKWGTKWREGIKKLVEKSNGFVPIVSPSYFNSRMCIFELDIATKAEKKILPIYFRECRELKSSFKEDGHDAAMNKHLNEVSTGLGEIQMRKLGDLIYEDFNSGPVQSFLDKISREIV